jgi:hypothetical protein
MGDAMLDQTVALIDNAVRDWETSGDAMRWAPTRPRPLGATPPPGTLSLTVDIRGLVKAFQQLQSVAEAVGHRLTVAFLDPRQRRAHRKRCRVCNPAGNPPPLAGKYKPGPKAARLQGSKRRG